MAVVIRKKAATVPAAAIRIVKPTRQSAVPAVEEQRPPLEVALAIARTLARQAARRDHAALHATGTDSNV